ncbi:hypothetical protein F5148DRAFT_1160550 [Russula earlei]|uniref:Uncharacterized protein n=1 Tax=Russula earlei TaxID=71964 RepID=A0ACC0UMF2_9AGAM|nr:hypothetical protein F5148DRAFT_1160550 [Russula earlei]
MWCGISSIAALFLSSAVRALPQGDLGDLLPVGAKPEFDEPGPVTVQTIHQQEQASTIFRVEHTTFSLPQLTRHAEPLTAAVTGVSSPHSQPMTTQMPTSQLPTPASEGGNTYTGVIITSTSQNATFPTSYPSSPPTDFELSQGHGVDWRVIGIAVIAVSVVGTMILVIVFFDQWWGFLCDLCGRRRKWMGKGKEEFVPDWERASWEFKIEDDNMPAYPSFGSPPVPQVQAQFPKVDMVHRPDKTVSPGCLGVPPMCAIKDNGEVFGTQGVIYGPARRCPKQFSPGDVVNEATAYKCHSPLSRSVTLKSTTTEDAYDGLAA